MDPVTTGLALGGLALQAFGTMQSVGASKQVASLSAANAGLEMQANEQRRQAMEIAARRQKLEALREAQRAQAQGLAAASSQGAMFGSGLAGGQAQSRGQLGTNLVGIEQNLEIGRNIFGIDTQISKNKIGIAKAQGTAATAAGISSLGGDLVKSASPLGNLSQNFFEGGAGYYGGSPTQNRNLMPV